MRSCTLVFVFCLSIALGSDAWAQPMLFKADLDEAQAGSTGSMATGTALLRLNDNFTELIHLVDFNGLTLGQISSVNIRIGAPGIAGPVAISLLGPNHDVDDQVLGPNSIGGIWDTPDTATGAPLAIGRTNGLTNLFSEQLYFNVETPAFPGGEIRGQIIRVVSGDVNDDGAKDILDIAPFCALVKSGTYQIEADMNADGLVNSADVPAFVTTIVLGCL